jgi:hypothetical protein
VIVPDGARLRALSASGGARAWEHVQVERHEPVEVECRVQGAEILTSCAPGRPGLEGPASPRPPDTLLLCVAGQRELQCLSLPRGTPIWRATKKDGCILSLHRVGDVDGDGTEDVVACGCNLAECFGGRMGDALWKYPVSGRSLWAAACGDLDGDGLGEVLLQAGTDLRVVSTVRPAGVRPLFPVKGFLPRACVPGDRSFLVAFGGASAWRWSSRGEGKEVWQTKGQLLGAFALGQGSLLATREGLWVEAPGGAWKQEGTIREVRAVTAARDRVLVLGGDSAVHEIEAGSAPRRILDVAPAADGLATNRDGSILCVLSGPSFHVHQREPGRP